MSDPLVSVIIPFKNEEATLHFPLDSLLAQETDFPVEVIFADGCSTDRSVEVIRNHPLSKKVDVKIISLPPENHGMTVARNRGAAVARGEYLIFMQADVRIRDTHAIAKVAKALEDQTVVATSFVGLSADAEFDKYDFWGKVFMARYYGNRVEGDMDTKFNGVRRSVFQVMGGFDEHHFAYGGEDFDFYVRLVQSGSIGHTDVEVEHLHGLGRRHSFLGLLKKYWRNAEVMGATTPSIWRHKRPDPPIILETAKRICVCLVDLSCLVPLTWPWSWVVLLLLGIGWQVKALAHVRGWRIALIPVLGLAAMLSFAPFYLKGLIQGRTRLKIEHT